MKPNTLTIYILQKLIKDKWYDIYENETKDDVIKFRDSHKTLAGDDYRIIKRTDEVVG